MGVRCTVLGHVHDTTEFEERQEKRPEGTVLICREYQVCRHCGDREELYRNEQLVEDATADTDETGGTAIDDATTDGSTGESGEVASPQSDETGDTNADRSEAAHRESDTESDLEYGTERSVSGGEIDLLSSNVDIPPATEVREKGDEKRTEPQTTDQSATSTPPTPGESNTASTAEQTASTTPAQKRTTEPTETEQAEILESSGVDGPAPVMTDGSSPDDANDRAFTDGDARTNDAPATNAPANADSSDSDIETVGDDAVILTSSSDSSESSSKQCSTDQSATSRPSSRTERNRGNSSSGVTAASSDSAFEIDDSGGDHVTCGNCDGDWDRNETSLRDGDLCPECRSGYVSVI